MASVEPHDPNAMPLGDFIGEAMNILKNSRHREICVERVGPLRLAEARVDYEAFHRQLNETGRGQPRNAVARIPPVCRPASMTSAAYVSREA